jgi:hypothetical protein
MPEGDCYRNAIRIERVIRGVMESCRFDEPVPKIVQDGEPGWNRTILERHSRNRPSSSRALAGLTLALRSENRWATSSKATALQQAFDDGRRMPAMWTGDSSPALCDYLLSKPRIRLVSQSSIVVK